MTLNRKIITLEKFETIAKKAKDIGVIIYIDGCHTVDCEDCENHCSIFDHGCDDPNPRLILNNIKYWTCRNCGEERYNWDLKNTDFYVTKDSYTQLTDKYDKLVKRMLAYGN